MRPILHTAQAGNLFSPPQRGWFATFLTILAASWLFAALAPQQARADTTVFLPDGGMWVSSVSISDDGRYGTTASSNAVILWDIRAQKMVRRFHAGGLVALSPASISPDGSLLASRASDGSVALWDVASGRLLQTGEGEGLDRYLGRVNFTSDGRHFFIDSGTLAVFETRTMDRIYSANARIINVDHESAAILKDGGIHKVDVNGNVTDIITFSGIKDKINRQGYNNLDIIGIYNDRIYLAVGYGKRQFDKIYIAYIKDNNIQIIDTEFNARDIPKIDEVNDFRAGLAVFGAIAVNIDKDGVLAVKNTDSYGKYVSESAASANGRFAIFAKHTMPPYGLGEITFIDQQDTEGRITFTSALEVVSPELPPIAADSIFLFRRTAGVIEATVFNPYTLSLETCVLPSTYGYFLHLDRLTVSGGKVPDTSCVGLITGTISGGGIPPGQVYHEDNIVRPPQRDWASGLGRGTDIVWRKREPRHFDVIPPDSREETIHTDLDGTVTRISSPGPFDIRSVKQRGNRLFAQDSGGNLLVVRQGTGELLYRTGDCSTASVQRILTRAGLNPGPVDGVAGRRTLQATRQILKNFPKILAKVEDDMLVEFACAALGLHGDMERASPYAVSQDGTLIAYRPSGFSRNRLTIINISDGASLWSDTAPGLVDGDDITHLEFTLEGRHLLYGTSQGSVVKMDLESKAVASVTRGLGWIETISAHATRTNHIYVLAGRQFYVVDHEKGEILLSAAFGTDGKWVALTPAGYFASGDGGEEMLQVSAGIVPLSLGNAFDVLSRPDLVVSRMTGERAYEEAAGMLDLETLFGTSLPPVLDRPRAGPVSPDGEVRVTVAVEAGTGGVGQVVWSVNGSVQAVTDIEGAAGPGSHEAQATLILPNGESVIEAKAFNRAGTIESNPVSLTVSASVETRESVMHVAVIGVNDYEDPRFKLNFAVPDARAVAEAFGELGRALHADVRVHMLVDRDVTRDGLSGLFARLAPEIRPNDVFVLFMAGHGVTDEGKYHFLPADFRYRDSSSIAREAIGQADLQRWLSSITAGKTLVMLDSCESGTLTEIEFATRGLTGASAIEKLNRAVGRNIIAAASATQEALEGYNGHGVFTWSLLEAASDADLDGDGIVDIAEAIQFLDRRVPDLAMQAFGMVQVPQVRMQGGNFPLLKAGIAPAVTQVGEFIPSRNTHVVVAPAAVHSGPELASPTGEVLAPGTRVGIMGDAGNAALLSRDGRRVGYVAADTVVGLN